EADVLKTEIGALFEDRAVVVGNLPYNISIKIFERCTNYIRSFKRLVFMFQKEAADRLIAEPGGKIYSSLSVYAAYHYEIKKVCRIGGGNFFPKTKASSSVLEFTPHERRLLPPEQEDGFFDFVRSCFRLKRKTLRNNTSFTADSLKELGFSESVRAEQLSIADFIRLYRELKI
ncbi:MAG: ribosomal RNA small subunit methyltransferase A, partial [Deferribacteraceae bacterium]|nr:ribosomal RNA small subunit methyltransferase A [Deferribacteraceae bacterium]